ncbi:Leucine dehydrogenase [Lentibacillus sp. JNUCC-1]|nr:Leucine dehydrogenase [Lentibacillus sp. JNUCC-1]
MKQLEHLYETGSSEALFNSMQTHEQVIFCNDPATGLQAIIAIHNTTLGPALGGTRMYPYASVEDALKDVLRLSEGMTDKCAAADIDFGGAKGVIIGDPKHHKTAAMFRSYGQFVESLNGRFYTGTDMGTTMDDFVHAAKETNFINGLPEAYGAGAIPPYRQQEGWSMVLRRLIVSCSDRRISKIAHMRSKGSARLGLKWLNICLNAGQKCM